MTHRSFFKASARVLQSIGWVGAVYVAIALVFLPVLMLLLKGLGRHRTQSFLRIMSPDPEKHCSNRQISSLSIDRCAEAIRVAGAHGLVNALCLPKSLLLWYLLRWWGLQAEVRIGVSKAQGYFRSHAWVELDGVVVNDRNDVAQDFVVVV